MAVAIRFEFRVKNADSVIGNGDNTTPCQRFFRTFPVVAVAFAMDSYLRRR
jgi:hypothetical protein